MDRARAHAWLSAALLLNALPALAAQEARPLSQCIRERWTYRDGLPHNVAHRVLAAQDGYLWIGTQEGLVRFDGVRFKTFEIGATAGLAGNEITALLEDERRVLWIGTSRGLSRLEADRFELVELGGDAAVTDLLPDGEGGVWVATEASGVARVRRGPGPAGVERLEGLTDPRVLTMAWVGRELWMGGYGGVARIVDGRVERLAVPGFPATRVGRIAAGRDGTIWIGSNGGLLRRRPGAPGFEPVPEAGTASVEALLEDRHGALWIGLEGRPLLRLEGGQVQPLPGAGGPTDVHTLAEGGDGDLWAGTEAGGLYRLRWGSVSTVATEEGLASDVVWAVREGRGGAMWVVSDGGLDRVRNGRAEPAHAAELRGASPAGLLEDRDGALWVGLSEGLVRFGPAGGTTRYGREEGLGQGMARAIHQDGHGTIWVGTSHGLHRLDGGRFHALASDPALAGDKVNIIEELPDGSLWVGTTTALARVEGDRLVAVAAGGRPLRADVTALHADAAGGVWVGTVGEGLLRLSGDRVERWTRREGLYEDTVAAILDDGAGALWLSGSHGITRVERAQLQEVAVGRRAVLSPTVFGTADGMRERECNGGVEPAAWRSSDGRLWFATIRGVVVIDPAHLADRPAPPPARVEEVLVDGRSWPPGAALRLPPATRRVDVRYTGLALAEADRIRFHYRLVGLDDTFLDAGGERVAHFTNLAPGRYTFEVAAMLAAGDWGRPATLAFEIEPHFWQTSWFALAVLAVALGGALAVHLARTAAFRRRESALAARVDEEMRKVKVLTGLLPTCAWCKKIRDQDGQWQQFETYVSHHTDATFSHGMCPECFARAEREGEP